MKTRRRNKDSLASLSNRRKRPRRIHHALALSVAVVTGIGAFAMSTNKGDANVGGDGLVRTLELPSADDNATRPEGLTPLKVLTEHAPERVGPATGSTAGSNGRTQAPKLQTASLTTTPEQTLTDVPAPADSLLASEASQSTAVASPAWEAYTVQSGDSLAALFSRAGLSARDVYDVVNAGERAEALTSLYPGDEIRIALDGRGNLDAVRYELNETDTLTVRRGADGYTTKVTTTPLERRRRVASGEIKSSLYASALEAGLSDRQVMQLASIFGWDIDFALDLRRGDRFRVIYNEIYRDGEKLRNGDIVAADFVNHGERFRAVRFTFPDGDAQYFTPDGKSMRKAFLRTPVNFTRVSSEFNPQRLHPILGTKRPHMGTDYAAPPGTPIKAAGDGRIVHIGRKGGYGNAIVIKHGSRYSTLYGHMRGFRRGLSHGDHVKQGEVIGYVGSSGLATGPHLHYEFRVNGKHRNPRTVKLPEAEPIQAKYREDFETQTAPLVARLEAAAPTQVASNGQTEGNAGSGESR
ncbi:peptidoglycan DD-metalloendopeptidase family protein [Arhodomonas aquaeolei]|uniref:OapA family protein n=1 Tax=Arhodomonas aquaeolei TaxID=2369 RepID=UPI002169501C|nr:peptidoglycan DD-metalloendopeptidase family protein [Arhodomonas aquaeolei]MCS4504216.1 peptidoglycan DD-metalloendopeptidase family protein [Arhodomonas aquaeolei]